MKCGLTPVVDVQLFTSKVMSDPSQSRKSRREPRYIGLENNGNGKIICQDPQHCVALLRRISTVPVCISIALEQESVDILRVPLALAARRKRRLKNKLSSNDDGSRRDGDDGDMPGGDCNQESERFEDGNGPESGDERDRNNAPGNDKTSEAVATGESDVVASGDSDEVTNSNSGNLASVVSDEMASCNSYAVSSGDSAAVANSDSSAVASAHPDTVAGGDSYEVANNVPDVVSSGDSGAVACSASDTVASGYSETVANSDADEVASCNSYAVSSGDTVAVANSDSSAVASAHLDTVASGDSNEVANNVPDVVSSGDSGAVACSASDTVASGYSETVANSDADEVASCNSYAVSSGDTVAVANSDSSAVASAHLDTVASGDSNEVANNVPDVVSSGDSGAIACCASDSVASGYSETMANSDADEVAYEVSDAVSSGDSDAVAISNMDTVENGDSDEMVTGDSDANGDPDAVASGDPDEATSNDLHAVASGGSDKVVAANLDAVPIGDTKAGASGDLDTMANGDTANSDTDAVASGGSDAVVSSDSDSMANSDRDAVVAGAYVSNEQARGQYEGRPALSSGSGAAERYDLVVAVGGDLHAATKCHSDVVSGSNTDGAAGHASDSEMVVDSNLGAAAACQRDSHPCSNLDAAASSYLDAEVGCSPAEACGDSKAFDGGDSDARAAGKSVVSAGSWPSSHIKTRMIDYEQDQPIKQTTMWQESCGLLDMNFGLCRPTRALGVDPDCGQKNLMMLTGKNVAPFMVYVLDCAFTVLVVLQALQVGLYCLPLVPRDRVYIAPLKFIETASLLHRFNIFFDRFQLFGDWLLAWLALLTIVDSFAGSLFERAPGATILIDSFESAAVGPDSDAAIGRDSDNGWGSDLWQSQIGLDYYPVHGEAVENWNMNNCNLGRMAGRDTFRSSDPFAFGPGSPARQGAEHE